MFSLEQSITEWRQRMLTAGIQTPVPLGELELHLREEIERQTRSGLGDAEAFQMAVENIGPAAALQKEFAQAGQNVELLRSRRGQYHLIILLGSIQLLVIGAVLFNSEMTAAQRTSGLAAIATAIFLAVFVGRGHRFFPVIRNKWRRLIVCFVSGIVPFALWVFIGARFFLVGHEFPLGQWLASLLWVMCPSLAIYLGIILGFETAARNEMMTAK